MSRYLLFSVAVVAALTLHAQNELPSIFLGNPVNPAKTSFKYKAGVIPAEVTFTYNNPQVNTLSSSSPFLDSLFASYMENYPIPGLVACIVKKGQVPWSGAYGYADIEAGKPMETSTLFKIASISKTFTVSALMKVWENGSFGLDDDIGDYLPFSVRNPAYPSLPITFRQLCTHTSSITDNWNVIPVYWGYCPDELAQYYFDYLDPDGELYNPDLNYFPEHAPSSYWSYSNSAVGLIGLLVQQMTGIPYNQYCHDNLFVPLGMDETAWLLSEVDTTNMARLYAWDGTGYIPYPHYSIPVYPAEALITSADQLANYLICYLQEGMFGSSEILQPSTIDSIFSIQSLPDADFQGLIWWYSAYSETPFWFHTGSFIGNRTVALVAPEEETGLVILINSEAITPAIVLEMADYLLSYANDSISLQSEENFTREPGIEVNIFPNPVSEAATITFELPLRVNANLSILDGLGMPIAELANKKSAQGTFSLKWETKDLPVGIYFYHLQAGDQELIGKILKVK